MGATAGEIRPLGGFPFSAGRPPDFFVPSLSKSRSTNHSRAEHSILIQGNTHPRKRRQSSKAREEAGLTAKRWWLRLHEKGAKRHEMPAHHKLEAYLDEYLEAAGIRKQGRSPLFRSTIGKTGVLTGLSMHRIDVYRMIRRRAASASFQTKIGCHTFRATGITAYLEAGGTLENAQAMAAHESPRTTKLYDRTADVITLDEVERIVI